MRDSTLQCNSLLPKKAPLPGHPDVQVMKPLSYPAYQRYRETVRSFSELVAYEEIPVNLAVPGAGNPLRAAGHLAADNYFSTLKLESLLGRTLSAPGKEGQPGVVISHRLWKNLFGGRDDVLGRPLLLNGNVFEVTGVLPEGFRGVMRTEPVDVWLPLEAASLAFPRAEGKLSDPENRWISSFFARLAPGMDVKKAQAELDVIARMLREGTPGSEPAPALEVFDELGTFPGTRKNLIDPLATLAAVAGLLMLLVCANLGGLLLTRAAARKGEIGIRVAFGATQGRLVWQLLTESLLLGLLGGAAGVALARGLVTLLEGVPLGVTLPALTSLGLDRWALIFALGVSLGAGIAFGLAPALWSSRPEWLREGGALQSRTGLQEVFLVSQIALSLTLLVGAGLFVRTWRNLQAVPLGFDSRVKMSGDPGAVAGPVRAEIARLDRNLPIVKVTRMEDEVREVLGQSLLFSKLLGSLSGVALLLTGIGLYGSLAYAVRRRTREMGVRKALGARTSQLLGLVLRRGLALTLAGLAAGALVSWAATRALAGLLFGVAPTGPTVFAAVLLICGLVGAAASLLPAWSAARVDPMEALRQE